MTLPIISILLASALCPQSSVLSPAPAELPIATFAFSNGAVRIAVSTNGVPEAPEFQRSDSLSAPHWVAPLPTPCVWQAGGFWQTVIPAPSAACFYRAVRGSGRGPILLSLQPSAFLLHPSLQPSLQTRQDRAGTLAPEPVRIPVQKRGVEI